MATASDTVVHPRLPCLSSTFAADTPAPQLGVVRLGAQSDIEVGRVLGRLRRFSNAVDAQPVTLIKHVNA